MKRMLKLLIIIFLCGLTSGLISLSPVNASAGADEIAAIRSRYATINKNLKSYRTVKKEISGHSTEGGELVAYFDGDVIKKIVAAHYGETGKATEEYYFWNNELMFVFRRDSRYDRPLSGKVVATEENRFYFGAGRLIRWIDKKGKQVSAKDSVYPEKQSEYLSSAKEFVTLARS
jgi:hypothetical protein